MAILMDVKDPEHILKLENAYFDATYTWVYGFKTLAMCKKNWRQPSPKKPTQKVTEATDAQLTAQCIKVIHFSWQFCSFSYYPSTCHPTSYFLYLPYLLHF